MMVEQIQILMVDDDVLQLELTSYQLEQIGFRQVTCFWGASEALQMLQDADISFSLIILDLNMPGMDGLEFLQQLRNTRFDGSLVLLSGENERILESAVKLASAYGLDVLGHLSKPTTQKQLQQALTARKLSGRRSEATRRTHTYSPERVHDAITNNELFNVYQPKVALSDGRIVSAEALVRWNHPDDGIIYPDHFIGIAEDNGLIDDLTRLVLTNALAQLKLWQSQGMMISVAVNVSMSNLTQRSFTSYLESLLTDAGIRPSELILEVTESMLMQDYATVLDILTRLRMRQVNLSIDDFGTGHSSIAQLRDIPFNELKIDRGFVHMAWKNPTLRAIFMSNVQLAKNLGIQTVAEGVEDSEDWKFLLETDCDIAQGYFISRPMAGSGLMAWKEIWERNFNNL